MLLSFIAEEDLYKKDQQLQYEDVKILLEWLKKQPHLPKLKESQVILSLHSCYYSIEASKTTIDAYFTRKSLHPEIFRYPNEDAVRSSTSNAFMNFLPKRTPQDYSIFVSMMLDFKPENYHFLNNISVQNLAITLHLHQYGFADGVVFILDTKGFSLGHLARINVTALKHMLDHVQEGMPIRIKQIHIVNTVPFMDKILSLIKPLLSSELYNMIELHSSFDTLYKDVPKECLPKDYGGELQSCRFLQEENLKNILDNRDFFEWHDSQKVDESQRMENSNSLHSGFGVEGTFKKLAID